MQSCFVANSSAWKCTKIGYLGDGNGEQGTGNRESLKWGIFKTRNL